MILCGSYGIDADSTNALLNLILGKKVAQFQLLQEVIDNFDLK